MLEALESLYGAEECHFRTIFGILPGYKIYASRKVAEKAELGQADVRELAIHRRVSRLSYSRRCAEAQRCRLT